MKQLNIIIFFLLLIAGVYSNITFTTIPFTVVFLLGFAVLKKSVFIYFLALITGIFLDSIAFRMVGITSIILILMVYIIFLYERKIEVKNRYFYGLIVLIFSYIYMVIFGYSYALLQSLVASICGFLSFLLFIRTNRKLTTTGF
jgi:hypothetical protein